MVNRIQSITEDAFSELVVNAEYYQMRYDRAMFPNEFIEKETATVDEIKNEFLTLVENIIKKYKGDLKMEELLKDMHEILMEHKRIANAEMSVCDKQEAYQDCLQDLYLCCCEIDEYVEKGGNFYE